MNSWLLIQIARILTYTGLAFFLAMWIAPWLIQILVWLKFWKKQARSVSTTGEELIVTKKFYEENERDKKVPRAGGILIWFVSLFIAVCFWIVLKIEPESKYTQFINFVSRKETFIPIGTLFFGAILGLVDDILVTLDDGGNYIGGGLKLSQRAIVVTILSLLIGIWFYTKNELHQFHFFTFNIDLYNLFGYSLGWLVIPLTFIILLALWGSSVIDGFDGIAAGTLIPIFICFALLSLHKGYFNIATLMMVIVGSMTAYLWFNLPPAKFIMGDTGSVPLLLTLGVVAIFIDYIYILPIAGIALLATLASDVIQIFSKKVFKKKVFKAAPLHHHFEALGYSRQNITISYWLVSLVFSTLGLVIGLWLG
jgi:phospho-N-acetylmuramoyl-pentapeptide-transferase